MTVRRSPFLAWLTIAAAGGFLLLFIWFFSVGALVGGCLGLIAPIGLLVYGIRQLNSIYLTYDRRSQAIAKDTRGGAVYRPRDGEQLFVSADEIHIMGADGRSRRVPVNSLLAHPRDWQALLAVINGEDTRKGSAAPTP